MCNQQLDHILMSRVGSMEQRSPMLFISRFNVSTSLYIKPQYRTVKKLRRAKKFKPGKFFISELQDVTKSCVTQFYLRPDNMRAHPTSTPASKAGIWFTCPGGMKGWVDRGALIMPWRGIEPTTAWSKVRHPNCCATKTLNRHTTVHLRDDLPSQSLDWSKTPSLLNHCITEDWGQNG